MGRRGPAPKPTALKLIAGNPGRRPLNTNEPVPPSGEPVQPAFLDASARAVWAQIVPDLAKCGLARSIDGVTLGRYCVNVVLWTEAVAFVRKNGSTYAIRDKPTGETPGKIIAIKEYPQSAMQRKLAQLLLQIEREFGLTPAARTRIKLEQEAAAGGDVNELKRRFFAQGPNKRA